MTDVLIIIVLVFGVILANLFTRLKALETKSRFLEDLIDSGRLNSFETEPEPEPEPEPDNIQTKQTATAAAAANNSATAAEPQRSIAKVISSEDEDAVTAPPESVADETQDTDAVAPASAISGWKLRNPIAEFSFEDFVGGKLPIWIGGIALIFAGFFMIRYSIDAGLFGPGLRTMTATIFGLLLIALSEFGGRVPRIGHVFSDDARIRQTLAGAGIAILYATLYLASELYGLVGLQSAFLLVIAVTLLALFLSLRRGPPTAIMGVIGGFAAPWVAQMGPDSMPALLMYLGVFIAGLFGLSIWQRWLWLLLIATGGGAIWTAALVVSAQSGLPLLGAFITLVGAAAILCATRIQGGSTRRDMIAVYAPLSLAMLQIAVLLPRMEFSPLGWAFLLALGILAIALAWRDIRLQPLAYLAAIISIFPILNGWIVGDLFTMAIITAGYALMYTAAGQLRIWRGKGQSAWSGLAIFPPIIVAVPFAFQNAALSDGAWAAIALMSGMPAAVAAWRYRDEATAARPVSVAAASVCVLLFAAAALIILPADLIAAILLIAAASLAAWGRFTMAKPLRYLAVLPLTLGIFASFIASLDVLDPMMQTLTGSFAIYAYLPAIGDNAVDTLLPALLLIAMAIYSPIGLPPAIRNAALVAGGVGISVFLWLVSRGIFTISTPADFIQYGFAERMLLTLTIGIAGAAAIWQGKRISSDLWLKIGVTLLCVVAARVIQFDLLLYNPVARAQTVGPAPIANLATILGTAMVILFWFASRKLEPADSVLADHETTDNLAASDMPNAPRASKTASALPRVFYGLCLAAAIVTALVTVRQLIHGSIIANAPVTTNENYLYSVALLLLSLAWLARGILSGARLLRIAGLALLTIVTLKVFMIDAAALEGILRILSFLGLGTALIAIGWAYGRLIQGRDSSTDSAPVT